MRVLAFVVGLILAAPVAAQDPVTFIDVAVDPCVPVEQAELLRLLRLELGPAVQPQAGTATADTVVAARCAGDRVVVTYRDHATATVVERTLDTDSLRGRGGTRLLALAMAELVVASWQEARLAPTNVPSEDQPPADPPVHAARRQNRQRFHQGDGTDAAFPTSAQPQQELRLGIGLVGLTVPGPAGPTWLGVRLFAARSWVGRWVAAANAELLWDRVTSRHGTASSRMLNGRALIRYAVPTPPAECSLGAGGMIALASFRGEPVRFHGAGGIRWMTGGPLIDLRVATQTQPWAAALNLEVGLIVQPLRVSDADGNRFVDVSGLWLGIALEVGASL